LKNWPSGAENINPDDKDCQSIRTSINKRLLMKVYTYSQARKNLKSLLDEAQEQGEVTIRHRNGESFVITPSKKKTSHLDAGELVTNIPLEEINKAVQESRRC
jgi:prevent-host-death family protein